jgi:hypothetical protein
MYASTIKPHWIGQSIGIEPRRVWPVVIDHENSFEPAILHEAGGCVWRDGVPWRMSLQNATVKANDLAKPT